MQGKKKWQKRGGGGEKAKNSGKKKFMIICLLVPGHAEQNSACGQVSSTDHMCLTQYGCDWAYEEAGHGLVKACMS
jgi:hypothetical protein